MEGRKLGKSLAGRLCNSHGGSRLGRVVPAPGEEGHGGREGRYGCRVQLWWCLLSIPRYHPLPVLPPVLTPPVLLYPLQRRIESVAYPVPARRTAYIYRCPAAVNIYSFPGCVPLNSDAVVTFPSRSAASTCSPVVSTVPPSAASYSHPHPTHRQALQAAKAE